MKLNVITLIIGAIMIVAGCSPKQPESGQQTSDTIAKAPVTENKMMIVAKVFIKKDKVKNFIEAAKEMVEKTNTESGCKFYQLYQDPYDNTKFVFVEEYINQAAIDTHFGTEYFKAFGKKTADLTEKPAEVKIVTVAKEEIK